MIRKSFMYQSGPGLAAFVADPLAFPIQQERSAHGGHP